MRTSSALDGIHAAFARFPMIPALKSAIGIFSHDDWGTGRSPLVALTITRRVALKEALTHASVEVPGIDALA